MDGNQLFEEIISNLDGHDPMALATVLVAGLNAQIVQKSGVRGDIPVPREKKDLRPGTPPSAGVRG